MSVTCGACGASTYKIRPISTSSRTHTHIKVENWLLIYIYDIIFYDEKLMAL